MVINNKSGLISTICLFTILHSVLALELVPVFMWSNSKSSEIVPALTQVNKATFTEILFDIIEKSNPQIIVLAEENLSPEDFRDQRKKTFQGISLMSANNRVTYLPLVEDPIDTVKDLPDTSFTEVSITDISGAKDIPEEKVVIISLDDAQDDEDRTDMLRRHDVIVTKLFNELEKSDAKVLVLFTGYHSSWIMPEQIKNHRTSRSVTTKAADEDLRTYINTTNIAIFLNSTIKVTKDTTENYLLLTELKTNENDSLTIATNATDGTTVTFETSSDPMGYWHLSSIVVGSETYKIKNAYAPKGFSYHCSKALFVADEKNTVEIPEFQIQFYFKESINQGKFGDAYDCVGFTSAPIWSGLFITFILALIMTLGLTMMMDIKTMDRFDDPKGKTIIINASE